MSAINRQIRRQMSKRGNLEKLVGGAVADTQQKIERDTELRTATIFLEALRIEYGWGKDRMSRLYKRMGNISDCIMMDLVTFDDIQAALKDECSVSFETK